jgi:hypothetical protein
MMHDSRRVRRTLVALASLSASLGFVTLVGRPRPRPSESIIFHSTRAIRACCANVDPGMAEVIDCHNRTQSERCPELCAHAADLQPPSCFNASAVRAWSAGGNADPRSVGTRRPAQAARPPPHAASPSVGAAALPSDSPSLCPQRGGPTPSSDLVQNGCLHQEGRHGAHATAQGVTLGSASKPVHHIDGSGQTMSCWMACADPAASNMLSAPARWGQVVYYDDGCCPPLFTRAGSYATVTQLSGNRSASGPRHAVQFLPDLSVPLWQPMQPDAGLLDALQLSAVAPEAIGQQRSGASPAVGQYWVSDSSSLARSQPQAEALGPFWQEE